MGMDLMAKETTDATQDGLHYNWSGWQWLARQLTAWGVPTDQLSGLNDGDPISSKVCNLIADAIMTHRDEYNQSFAGDYYGPDPATTHARFLRESGGVRQW